jgi:WD40-like Beta Propeller Repeat
MTTSRRLLLALSAAALVSAPAVAHHRQSPEVLQYTLTGDVGLPRLPALGRTTIVLAIPSGADTQIVTVQPYRNPSLLNPIGPAGDNQNPSISFSGGVVAWDTADDPIGTGLTGRQIIIAKRGALVQGTQDPTGTSTNPSLDVAGSRLAFESNGDLAATGNPGARQVFLRQPTGLVSQVSTGLGSSTNPTLSPQKHLIAFQSTSDPLTGLDTGISQIWIGPVTGATAAVPITAGLVSSSKPTFSDDGAVLAFESRANLANDQTDLGAPQIFIYHVKTKTYAQLTREPGGCTDPAVARFKRDWRVAYLCGGAGYVYFLRADERTTLETGGDTARLVPEPGAHFFVVSTTGDLIAGTGTTAGHQVYQVNAYKRPLTPFDTGYVARWFPFRGIPPSL